MSPQIARPITLAAMDLEQLRAEAEAAAARPEGQPGLGVDLYRSGSDRLAVCLYHWRAGRWQRFRRLSGPKAFDTILTELERAARRLGYPIIGAWS